MTLESDKKLSQEPLQLHNRLFANKGGRLRFCLTALCAIFIAEACLMLILPLLPPMPILFVALLDAFLLVFIIFTIFMPRLKKEMTFQNERFAEAQETLRKNEERYRALVESTKDSIYLVNRQYCYLFMNQNHLSRLGYSAAEFFNRPYSDFHSENESREFEAVVDEVFATGKSIQQEHQSLRDNRYFLRTLSPVRENDGRVSAVMIISKEITKQKEMEEALRKLSLTDELTGLYNRRGFMTLAAQKIKIATRLNSELLLISTDLDDLKIINDTMGHKEGDQAIVDIANILQETFRSSDIIARIGGDEFVVLQIKNPDEPSLSASTARLKENLADYNRDSGKDYKLSLSTGSVVYRPEDISIKTLDQLLAEADARMYQEKKQKNSKQ